LYGDFLEVPHWFLYGDFLEVLHWAVVLGSSIRFILVVRLKPFFEGRSSFPVTRSFPVTPFFDNLTPSHFFLWELKKNEKILVGERREDERVCYSENSHHGSRREVGVLLWKSAILSQKVLFFC
jgi:hypothetical protein